LLDIFHIHDFFYDTKQNVKSLCIHFRYCPKQSKECITYAPQTQFQPKKTIDRINIHDYFLVRPKKCELFYIHVHTLPILMGSLYQQSSIYYKAPNKENFNLNIKFAPSNTLHIQPASKDKVRKFTCITKFGSSRINPNSLCS